MEHVRFTHQCSSHVIADSDGELTIGVSTHIVAWVEGYERPLLCSRYPTIDRVINETYDRNLQEAVKLWASPLRYADPPLDNNTSPTGAPWVIYCEKNASTELLSPLWFEEKVRTGYRPEHFWEPLSAAWKLKDALAPVVEVVRERHQPFVAKLHESKPRSPTTLLQRIIKDGQVGPEPFSSINIGGDKPCTWCGAGDHVGVCAACERTGLEPRWWFSIQCGFPPFGCAPMLRRAAVDNDLTAFFLWEVSSNFDAEEIEAILLRKHGNVLGPWARNLAERVCNAEPDGEPARNVTAKDIQTVIDALEWEAQNTGGPALSPPEPPSAIVDKSARHDAKNWFDGMDSGMGAKAFVDALRRDRNFTSDDARKMIALWKEQWPEVAEYFERVLDGSAPAVTQDDYDGAVRGVGKTNVTLEGRSIMEFGALYHKHNRDGLTERDQLPPKVFQLGKCSTEGCSAATRPHSDLCEQHHREAVVAGVRGALAPMRVKGIRTKDGRMFDSIEQMNAVHQRDERTKQERREASSFKRKDTKKSAKGRGRR